MKVTKEMIEAGAIALAEWSAPNWGKSNWEKSDPGHEDAYRRAYRGMSKEVLKAALEEDEIKCGNSSSR